MIVAHADFPHHVEDSGIVYLAAPIPLYGSARYERAIRTIREEHPDKSMLISRNLFRDNLDFNLNYRDKLGSVTQLYILPDNKGFVGAGVYTEWEYLKFVSPNCREAFAFDPGKGFGIYSGFTLEPLSSGIRTMREFAKVTYPRER